MFNMYIHKGVDLPDWTQDDTSVFQMGLRQENEKNHRMLIVFMYIFYDCTSIFILILKGEPKTGKGFST